MSQINDLEINTVDYKPTAPNFKQLVLMNFQGLTNFPYIEEDFDALTNYGLLSKVVEYLNQVIANNNEQNSLMTALYNAYSSLQDYVNNSIQTQTDYINDYFNNLDVQEEINNKLDAMARDGSLTELIKEYVDPIYEEFENEITTQVNSLTNRVNGIASGSPLVVSSLSDMTDTTRIYVLTTDGNWYFYDGDSWEVGGVYQATQIDNDNIVIDGRNTKTSKLALYQGYEEYSPISSLFTFEHGDIGGSVGNEITFTEQQWRLRTPEDSPIVMNAGEYIYIQNMSDGAVSTRLFTCDNDNTIISMGGWYQQNFYIHGRSDRKYYLAVQITNHYNYTVNPEDIAKIRIKHKKKTRQNYLHNIFDVNVLPFGFDRGITYDYNARCITDYFDYDGKIKIKSSSIQFMILQFNKVTKEYIHDETPFISNTLYYNFSSSYSYRIIFRKSDNSALTPTEVLNDVKIYPIEQADSTINYNFSNMILNNHQGYSSEYFSGMNLAESYYNSFLQGYKNAECDVRFTLDNVPVCSHDASFVDGSTTVVIAETNYEDLIEYDYYDGNHISSLDEVMSNCKKYGLTLQLDQLSAGWSDTQWNNLFKVINKYQMKDYVMYSAGNQTLITKVLTFDSKAKCIVNISNLSSLNDMITLAHNNKNGKNKFILAINYTLITPEQVSALNETLEEDVYIAVWTIDNLTTLLNYLPYAYMITTNKITPSEIINEFVH